ncbi:MAG: hypothetical protein JXB62_07960 [Pirellulales bacterium]|nr:hypothetical protein [Pirellulales bacterium]
MSRGMSPHEFQNYLGLLSRLLRLRSAQREAVEDELRAHLEDRFAALTSRGIEPDRAISLALAEFGDAAALAAEFSAVSRIRRRRWMMRLSIVSMAASVLVAAVVASLWPDSSGPLADGVARAQQAEQPAAAEMPEMVRTAKTDANAETRQKLEKLATADFIEYPLVDVLAHLTEVAGVQVYVDHRSLDEVGIQPDVPITMDLKDVPVEMLLRLILRQLDLTYMLDHGVVVVTTPEEVEQSLEIRVYRVDGLVEASGPQAALEAATESADPYFGRDMRPGHGGRPHGLDELISLITSTVVPESWEDVGGPATIKPFRDTLVVLQTQFGQHKVEKLLQHLREAVAKEK